MTRNVRNGSTLYPDPSPTLVLTHVRVLDLTGYSVMPGIVGLHNHLYYQ